MFIQTAVVEVIDGQAITQVSLINDRGTKACFLSLGATWQSFFFPQADGSLRNLVLGHDFPSQYLANSICAGQTVGRVAGRIKAGQAQIGELTYQLPTNNQGNTLHGGPAGLHRQNWDYELIETAMSVGVAFRYRALEEVDGFPGDMSVTATYLLDNKDRLTVTYEGVDATVDTLFNPTNHVYFNLGEGEDLEGHQLFVAADTKLETDTDLIPTGRRLDVMGTPYDFRHSHDVMTAIRQTGGLDDAFELTAPSGHPVAILSHEASGHQVTLYAECNGLVVYSFNWPETGVHFSRSSHRENVKNEGLALEAQQLPDAIHHPDFGNVILKAGERMCHTIVYAFEQL